VTPPDAEEQPADEAPPRPLGGGTPTRPAGEEGSKVVVLAGGTGGAKLARGMLDAVGPDDLVVIANTGDDVEIYGAHVSPDPDLVSFWLADLVDERGWGLRDDTFAVMDALRELGAEVWFNLGDRDLAWCLERRRMEDGGSRPTEALRQLNARIGVEAAVLPMSDEPVRTFVRTADRGWRAFQEFMVRDRCSGGIEEVAFRSTGTTSTSQKGAVSPSSRGPGVSPSSQGRGVAPSSQDPGIAPSSEHRGSAPPSEEILAALDAARAVIVGPSNPVISIWPILSVLADRLASLSAPVVCVSPIVAGEVVKGPTAEFMAAYRQPASADGVAAFYETVAPGLLAGMVADEAVFTLPSLQADTLMADGPARARVAEQALSFALSLAG
jgi:LPPG:FO 2-phospho-L-lactate transferase